MAKSYGKSKINKANIEIAPTQKAPKVAKNINASFLGAYSYYQPGRANQYDIGTDNFNGITDIPMYIALMNEKNGGVIYFPTNLKQKYQFYRYFYRCFVDNNVRVTLKDGTQKSIKDLQIGQSVLNINGQIVQIDKKIQNQYNGEIYQLKCQGKKPLIVTKQHPFYVLQKGKIYHRRIDVFENGKKVRRTKIEIDYSPVWKTAQELKVGDSFIVPNVFSGNKDQISVQLARLIGYFASEGSFIKRGGKLSGVRFSFNSKQLCLIQQVSNLLKLFSKSKICIYKKQACNCTTVYVSDVQLAKLFQYHTGGVALTKKFSEQIMNLSVQKTKHLLATYINGDGHITKQNQIQVTTISQDMANQIYFLYAKCGYSPTRYQIERVYPQHNTNMIYISTHDSNDLSEYTNYKKNNYFCSSRHRKYNYQGNVILPIRKITKSNYNGVVYNISTNGIEYQDRTFLVENIATHNCDAYVGAAIDLHTDLPMSKMSLKMPKMQNEKRRQYIKKKYQHMCDKLDLFKKLRSILFQYYVIGNCFIFLQYNKASKQFDKIVILPPQDCNITNYPFSSQSIIVYNQQQIIQLVKRLKSINGDYSGVDNYLNDQIYASQLSQMDKRILKNIPQQLLQHVFKNESIVFDTDPYAGGQLGSFAFVMSRNKHDYATLGASILQRIFVPLMQKLHYTYTQWSLASRNMTPRNKVTAPQVSPQQLDQLRQQFDLSMSMPQYAIVTNYDWNWQIVGADNRLIDLGRQYQVIENQIFAGLNVTRQVLTGQGMYSAGHINVQVMNAKYLLVRQLFKNMVQKKIFQPIAQQNGFYDIDSDGFKHYYYPKLSFERLNIVDNDQNFDKLFNLYQKGSLPVGYIYEILNIDEQQATEKLRQDMFTVKDATFNEMIRETYNRVGDDLQQKSNISQLISKSIYVGGTQITFNSEQQGDSDSDNPFGGDSDSDNPFGGGQDNSNPFEDNEQTKQQENKQQNNEVDDKQIEKHSVEISDEDFIKFLQTQELVATDQDIKQFLKDQNIAVVKNKDFNSFLQSYFLKPSNKDVDQFMDVIDTKLHPNNKMFENFLQQLNITKVTNKDVEQFLKLFFLKPTNKQIIEFLKRYGYVQVTDDEIQQFLNENQIEENQQDKKTLSDDEIQQFLNSQDKIVVNNQDVNNFQLMHENKFKI